MQAPSDRRSDSHSSRNPQQPLEEPWLGMAGLVNEFIGNSPIYHAGHLECPIAHRDIPVNPSGKDILLKSATQRFVSTMMELGWYNGRTIQHLSIKKKKKTPFWFVFPKS